jgi:hypothetical protein
VRPATTANPNPLPLPAPSPVHTLGSPSPGLASKIGNLGPGASVTGPSATKVALGPGASGSTAPIPVPLGATRCLSRSRRRWRLCADSSSFASSF